ncbi:MAG: ABC transporter permease [Saprospiraceae bacterium]|nr:ABC transporter permease [Lewinella sp.]
MKTPAPPKFFLRFFKWFCDSDLHPFVEGDLYELYRERVEALGKKKADRRFALDVLLLFRPGMIRKIGWLENLNTLDMFKHNLLISFRNFKRNKTAFGINLLGLATGLTCVLLIYLWVRDERNVDQFFENDDRLYQVMQHFYRPDGIQTMNITPAQLAQALVEQLPEVEYAVPVNNRYYGQEDGVVSVGDRYLTATPLLAGKDYFQVFSYTLLEGSKEQVLAGKDGIVLTESLARSLFGTTDNIVGRSLNLEQKLFDWQANFLEGAFQVSGLMADPPPNATAQFDMILPYAHLLDYSADAAEWHTDAADTYVLLREGTNIESLNEKMTSLLRSKDEERQYCALSAQQYSTRYLYGNYENGVPSGGRISYVRLFTLTGVFLLLIACVNFMNMATARASTRQKEVGVKKATGASRKQLIFQFLSESTLLAVLAAVIAVGLTYLLLPQFSEMTGKELHFGFDPGLLLGLLSIVLLTGLIAGSYPALYLSGFHPMAMLKGKEHTSLGEQWVRKGLVVFQFSLSVVFIAGVLILNRQMTFLQQKQLGYQQDNIITFTSKGKTSDGVETFMAGLREIPGVVQATNIWGGSFLKNKDFGAAPHWEGQAEDETIIVPRPHVGYNFIETLGIELKEGRSFSRAHQQEENKVILNEAAVALIGYDEPVGKMLTRGDTKLEIIGVVKDFHNESLHQPIKPTFIRFLPSGKGVIVRMQAGTESATIERLKDYYEQFHPGYPFEFSFMDAEYQTLYESEQRVTVLSDYAAGIAIIVSCLGLFGLATFTMERRKKEIGIRKVLGASLFGLVRLLSSDFTKTVLGAIALALPLCYLLAKNWLAGFAYRIELQWWLFLLPGLMVLLMAWGVVGIQTMKAARANPVDSLKVE